MNVEKEAGEFQKVDGKFRKVVDKLKTKIWSAQQSDDVSRLVHYMQINRDSWHTVTDHYGRSILHYAVEEGNLMLVKTLLNVGVNPNVNEKCGATPLTLAVIKKNEEAVDLLLVSYAEYNEKFLTAVPGRKVMAEKLKLPLVVQLFDDMSVNEASCDDVIWNTVEIGTGSRDHSNCVCGATDDPQSPSLELPISYVPNWSPDCFAYGKVKLLKIITDYVIKYKKNSKKQRSWLYRIP